MLGDKSFNETKAAHLAALADCATKVGKPCWCGPAYVHGSYKMETKVTEEVAKEAMKRQALVCG